MNEALPEPYVIEGQLPDRYPRGWFCIGTDYEFTSVPTKLDYFGTSMVAYRGAESGAIHVLDAYCPHMGANLAGGHIVGDCGGVDPIAQLLQDRGVLDLLHDDYLRQLQFDLNSQG